MKLRSRAHVTSSDSERRGLGSGSRLLLVTEDPFLMEEVHATIGQRGVDMVTCMGPTASPCMLEAGPTCPLAARATVALVDQPPGGAFRYHWNVVSARDYAERLQLAHPSTAVVLSARDDVPLEEGEGEVPFMTRSTALLLLNWMASESRVVDTQAATPTRGGGS